KKLVPEALRQINQSIPFDTCSNSNRSAKTSKRLVRSFVRLVRSFRWSSFSCKAPGCNQPLTFFSNQAGNNANQRVQARSFLLKCLKFPLLEPRLRRKKGGEVRRLGR